MNNRVIAGHYELVKATLTSYDGLSQPLDGVLSHIYITESINNDCLRGSVKILDKIGILETLPIRGEETLEMTLLDVLGNERSYVMSVYKVTGVETTTTNDGVSYTLHFISKSRFIASFRRIIDTYNNSISDIVEDLYEKYYNINDNEKELILEDTFGIFRCIIPNYTPMQAMNFLASRAYSLKSPSCSFRFFETYDNYHFVSDEQLIRKFTDNPDNIKEFAYSDAVDKSGQKDLYGELQNITGLSNTDRVNSLSDLLAGAYRSHTIEIDLTRKTVTLPTKNKSRSYNYEEKSYRYQSVSGEKAKDVPDPHSAEFIKDFYTEESQKRYIVVKDYDSLDFSRQLKGNQFLPEIAMNRTAYRHALNNTALNISINGRFDINAGDIIRVNIPRFMFAPAQGSNVNEQLSGNYIVRDLQHSFELDVHTINLKILKYEWDIK